ncbi:MAG TPA: hypothetical protein PKA28_11310 [Methylomusa anaerophila]|uniref:Uncharacterized protein n=1 Tax=Methylomusa anaerophila TaxID=1930071 RepID=A0A348AJ98_9FIRM|nr:hypothetical protein [Methylomusa anaerophila]BBB91146.1 hypothetical protein MAMMFC1_01817 [Methylomusa anaerophila]HML89022.1 hypothetical protein [Methylomusa anaerophila]
MDEEFLRKILEEQRSMGAVLRQLLDDQKQLAEAHKQLTEGQKLLSEGQQQLFGGQEKLVADQKQNADFIQKLLQSAGEAAPESDGHLHNNAANELLENLANTVAKVESELKKLHSNLRTIEAITAKNWNELIDLQAGK